jgi:hypothetical protein
MCFNVSHYAFRLLLQSSSGDVECMKIFVFAKGAKEFQCKNSMTCKLRKYLTYENIHMQTKIIHIHNNIAITFFIDIAMAGSVMLDSNTHSPYSTVSAYESLTTYDM